MANNPIPLIEVYVITPQNITSINPNLKYTIKTYLPLDQKILLYDMLLFLSLKSEFPMACSASDISSFTKLVDFCTKLNVSVTTYVSCAYNYIEKYARSSHRLGVAYFLNPKVIEYCGQHLEGQSDDILFYNDIKTCIMQYEKRIRKISQQQNLSYKEAFDVCPTKPDYFLAYKHFTQTIPSVDPHIQLLSNILQPIFTYVLHVNGVYLTHSIKEWNNSKLKDYEFCPRYFVDRYITNELTEDILGNSATKQGTLVHSIFEDTFASVIKKQGDTLYLNRQQYLGTIKKKLNSILQSKKIVDGDIQDHLAYIEEILTDGSSPLHKAITNKSSLLLEHKMSATLGGVPFVGTADMLIVTGTHVTVVDYKTSKLTPQYYAGMTADYTKQLSLYAKLFMALNPQIQTASGLIVYTRGKCEEIPTLIPNIVDTNTKKVAAIQENLRSGIIATNKSSCRLCRHPTCKFRAYESMWDSNGNRKSN